MITGMTVIPAPSSSGRCARVRACVSSPEIVVAKQRMGGETFGGGRETGVARAVGRLLFERKRFAKVE